MRVVRIDLHSRLPNTRLFPDVNVYLLIDSGEALLVDAGYGFQSSTSRIMNAIKRYHAEVSGIVITHGHVDHFSSAGRLRRRLDCTVMAHGEDASFIEEPASLLSSDPFFGHDAKTRALGYVALKLLAGLSPCTVDKRLKDGDEIRVGNAKLRVLHTPGHTKGHICLYEPERGLLFTGDHVISAGLSWILPTRGDVKEYVQSLKRLLKLRISLILPGHGRPLRNCRSVLLDRLARVSSRERSILRLLRKGPMDEDGLLKGLWYGGNPLNRLISRPVLRAYLKKLLDERRIAIIRAGNRTFYTLS